MNFRLMTFVLVTLLITTVATVLADDISGTMGPWTSTWNRVEGGSVSVTCNSEVVDANLDGQYYESHCIEVLNSDPIDLSVFASQTNIDDTTLTLYCEPFDPDNPLLNVIAFDDNDGEGLHGAFTIGDNITLTPGNTYWLVFSPHNPGVSGYYTIGSQSSNVRICGGPVPVAPATWGQIKATYR